MSVCGECDGTGFDPIDPEQGCFACGRVGSWWDWAVKRYGSFSAALHPETEQGDEDG